MSRPSIGDTPMTGAERQARYRAARAGDAPILRVRRPADRRSRIQRWNEAVAELVNPASCSTRHHGGIPIGDPTPYPPGS